MVLDLLNYDVRLWGTTSSEKNASDRPICNPQYKLSSGPLNLNSNRCYPSSVQYARQMNGYWLDGGMPLTSTEDSIPRSSFHPRSSEKRSRNKSC